VESKASLLAVLSIGGIFASCGGSTDGSDTGADANGASVVDSGFLDGAASDGGVTDGRGADAADADTGDACMHALLGSAFAHTRDERTVAK
jgi:hypothetical protein